MAQQHVLLTLVSVVLALPSRLERGLQSHGVLEQAPLPLAFLLVKKTGQVLHLEIAADITNSSADRVPRSRWLGDTASSKTTPLLESMLWPLRRAATPCLHSVCWGSLETPEASKGQHSFLGRCASQKPSEQEFYWVTSARRTGLCFAIIQSTDPCLWLGVGISQTLWVRPVGFGVGTALRLLRLMSHY